MRDREGEERRERREKREGRRDKKEIVKTFKEKQSQEILCLHERLFFVKISLDNLTKSKIGRAHV